MTAAAITLDEYYEFDPGWDPETIEQLTEDELVALLMHRLRRLTSEGVDPCQALILASRLHLPIH